jgi:hypothetical protein
MKKISFLLLFLFTALVQLQAQNQKATVYLLRPDVQDIYVPYYTYMDQTLLCKLGKGKYSIHTVEPGQHKMHVQYRGKVQSTHETELVVNYEAGKTYYVSVNLETKAFGKGRFYCELLSEENGKKYAEVLKLDTKCE